MICRAITILSLLLLLFCSAARATHIVGGEFTYVYAGDSVSGGITFNKYTVSLSIYENCLTGSATAIASDNPAQIGVFDAVTGETIQIDDSIFFASAIPVPANFSNSCVNNVAPSCLTKKTFVHTFALRYNTNGYVVAYERCCRNGSIINIVNPLDSGSTYYCKIPPGNTINNSAVFNKYPPQIICLNVPLIYDNSATDPDGDSLSYGFCAALNGGTGFNNQQPYYPIWSDSVQYVSPPFSSQVPMTGTPAIHINPVTGLITGTPNLNGVFLVTVYCDEWRNGALINTVRREFQFVVQPCTKAVIADMPQYSTDSDTYIIDCKDYTVSFVNTSKGGFAYSWNFGVPGSTTDVSTAFEPTFTYPYSGVFPVKLIVNPGSTCADSITRLVKLYPTFTAAFADSGNQCPGSPIYFTDESVSTYKPITNWLWNFGDGITSTMQDPVHGYATGGIYNVVLISENVKHCTDTALQQVVVDEFRAFAGDDTTIVKGSEILFDATGGIYYTWTPASDLSSTTIFDPTGYYPDTGHYTYNVQITSAYGCSATAGITVTVIDNAEFIVPTAFTPNGDGLNDYFKPVVVGYQYLSYFRIFNRWGEEVYSNPSLELGWDGTYKNQKAEMGTYYWEIGYTDRYGKAGKMSGDVTLIR